MCVCGGGHSIEHMYPCVKMDFRHTPPPHTHTQHTPGIFLSGGPGGHCPPLTFDNPKRSKIWYVACGMIIRRVAAAAKCESSAIDFWIFFKPFLDVL